MIAGRSIRDLLQLGPDERHRILEEWNATDRVVPPSTLTALVDAVVGLCPDAVAVVQGSDVLSYGALDARASQLAGRLLAFGCSPERVVAVAIEPSASLIPCILAVLKTGAAFVPLDPTRPGPLLASMLREADPVVVLTTRNLRAMCPPDWPILVVDEMDGIAASTPAAREPSPPPVVLQNLAYVIYTSGSTGTPKGVAVTHAGVASLVGAQAEAFGIGRGGRVLQFASFAVDAFIWDLVMALATGATLVVVTDEERTSGRWLEVAVAHQATCATVPPSALRGVDPTPDASLHTLIVAGEACPTELIARWATVCSLINAYGPTETTVCATISQRLAAAERVPPIGRPIWNMRAYVLDAELDPVAPQADGELYLAGRGLARGYLGRPSLTAERFIADPYGSRGSRTYRTGDLARWRADGQLEFRGRTDDQVKIRGFRVELGGIAATLCEDARVADAVAILRHDDGVDRLCAYVVARAGVCSDSESRLALSRALHHDLRRSLPSFMVPASVSVLERWPLTPAGKIDRRALAIGQPSSVSVSIELQTPEHEILSALFAQVLSVGRVGPDDDFLALGGDSLLAIQLAGRIRDVLGIDVPVSTLFEGPTVRQLASRLRRGGDSQPLTRVEPRPDRIPASYAQQRLWLVDRLQGQSAEYNAVTALRLHGRLDRTALERALCTIAARHESLRTSFVEIAGEPYQVIAPAPDLEIAFEDLRRLDHVARSAAVQERVRETAGAPLDLAHGPLLRVQLLRTDDDDHVLIRNQHHIITDAWSEAVFNRELRTLYGAFRDGGDNPLEPLPIQYADYALWERQRMAGAYLDEGFAYWRAQLSDLPDRLELPTDRPRSPADPKLGSIHRVMLPPADLAALTRVGQANQATLYATLLAALAVLLARYTGRRDIVVGSPIANRSEPHLERLIGLFVNSLILRIRLEARMPFDELLRQVRQTTLQALRYQDVPFEPVLFPRARTGDSRPFTQVVFAMLNTPEEPANLQDLEVESVRHREIRVRAELEVYVQRSATDGLSIAWHFNRHLFDELRIARLAEYYRRILRQISARPADRI